MISKAVVFFDEQGRLTSMQTDGMVLPVNADPRQFLAGVFDQAAKVCRRRRRRDERPEGASGVRAQKPSNGPGPSAN